jgi:hypothetical protein
LKPILCLPLRGGENKGNPSFVPPLKGEENEIQTPLKEVEVKEGE